jgi:serine/threonine-protein kinase
MDFPNGVTARRRSMLDEGANRMHEAVKPGDVVAGKYVIERLLGEGGMGRVLLARHPILGPCAVKLLHPEHGRSAEIVARFVREAQAVQRIRGEHVVRVSDVGVTEAGAPFMVMELLDGEDLAGTLRRRGPLPIAEAAELLLQACEALAEAHSEGIVHRDLKPANLFLTRRRDGSPLLKVLDFGISKMRADVEGVSDLTRTRGLMGTVLYMSPEQLQRPKEVDARSDVWALGVILFELLTGELPFLGDDMPNTILEIMMDEPKRLTAVRSDTAPAIARLVEGCLQKDRERRVPDVAAFAAGLAPFASTRGRLSAERVAAILGAGDVTRARTSSPTLAADAEPWAGRGVAATIDWRAGPTTTSGAASARDVGATPATEARWTSRGATIVLVGGLSVAAVLAGLGALRAFASRSSVAAPAARRVDVSPTIVASAAPEVEKAIVASAPTTATTGAATSGPTASATPAPSATGPRRGAPTSTAPPIAASSAPSRPAIGVTPSAEPSIVSPTREEI